MPSLYIFNVKKGIEVSILGQKIVVKTDQDEAFVAEVAALVNRKIGEVVQGARGSSNLMVALLACLNIAGEYLKVKRQGQKKEGHLKEKLRMLVEMVSQYDEGGRLERIAL